ncbi:hypothetical protein PDESU_01712 [Pontiella desulfatans]|uniref:Uncharacterized protein n=1 Tax=Pontiella desulfatans TaxID=2750659 RepID=A0A6C2TZK9_PONDE|nr:hypothetical protein [Pontiella desulfatans]VGO13158.1 hypothetical protein PDESU_01712 [Pontiella desulfatans]
MSVDLSGSAYQNLSEPTTFRIYAWGRGTTSTGATLAMIDKVTLHGDVTSLVETPYDSWASEYGLSGDDALANADAEGDGYDNLAEYALGMDPTSADAGSRESVGTVSDGGTTYFEYIHYRLTDYETEDISYWLIDSEDLLDSAGYTNRQDQILVGPEDNGYEPVTNRYEADESAMFIKVEIRQD